MEKINWVILGCGHIAGKMAKAFKATENSFLYGASSRNEEKAKSFAEEHGIPHYYGSYEKALEDPNVDAVYIATPHPMHKELSVKALNAKKAVLCEKPAAMNMNELKEILSAAEKNNTFFMEALWTKFQPAFTKAMELIRDGKIGKLLDIHSDICLRNDYKKGSRLYEKNLGGGSLLDLGIYMITSAYSALAASEKIDFASISPINFYALFRNAETGVDSHESIIFSYKNTIANLTSGFDTGCGENSRRARYSGDKGSIILENFWYAEEVKIYDENGNLTEKISMPFSENGYEYELTKASECISGGQKECKIHTWNDSVALCSFMDRILKRYSETQKRQIEE